MIGVCIKYFHENYGGMLQAYATVAMLESRQVDYELIQYEKKRSISGVIKSIPRLLNGVLLNDKKECLAKKIGRMRHPEFNKNEAIRLEAFKRFRESHFRRLSQVFCGYDSLCQGAFRYSAVMSGSDQLWSPAGLPTNYYNLMFVPDGIKKISYASSFGVSQIPWYQRKRTAEFLNRIDFISMREKRGSEIVKELTGKDVPTILDPVFNFDSKGWEKLIPINREFDEPYIFAYFLGNSRSYRKAVETAAKEMGCKIVTLRHLDQYIEEDERFGDYAPYDVGPDRFLNFLRGALYICTDSFHGMCFSIIHKKRFVVFNRYIEGRLISKNSRIDTLCDALELHNRRYKSEYIFRKQLISDIDYEKIYQKLEILKKKTDAYLDSVLTISRLQ